MPVEEQVVQIFAATNGNLDRIVIDKVERFLAELVDRVRGSDAELLRTIAGGDWSDETQARIASVVEQFAQDFGYDLDEEGHPIDENAAPRRETLGGQPAPAVKEDEAAAV